ncbi:hypothetical protein Pan97_33370 [Bremerella volcania]|uniref:Uncharacterized protein n=1 Tax=Bremerella volcania TaxID=2527984 RepID=A0A518CAR1_9BACT|nr:hypothetical protein [Bremerella volcania]QDU76290.1 hypothetical protein Pan97_33370 [Bremerella volcania]
MNTKSDTIMFLCPNGHRLNAPQRLQGQPGKCPHCNVRFRVPNVTPESADNTHAIASSASSTGASALRNSSEIRSAGDLPDLSDLGLRDDAETSDVLHSSIGSKQPGAPIVAGHSRMFVEFTHLWKTHAPEVSFEIHLPEGEVFVPHHYSPEKSSPELGYFVRKGESDKYQIHLIPWKAVCRLVVNGLADLPFDA